MKKRILISGATGFLGRYLVDEYTKQGWEIWTIGRSALNNRHIVADFSDDTPIRLPDAKFDQVIHAAGKAHTYPKTSAERASFIAVNERGTKRILNALANTKDAFRGQFILISTVAVYGREEGEMILENLSLKADSAYGLSKIGAEKLVINFCENNQSDYYLLRLPLVVGKDAPGNIEAISGAIQGGYYFSIKGNNGRKSVVLADDIARFLPTVSGPSGAYHLTDGSHPKFTEIEEAIALFLAKPVGFKLPLWVVTIAAKLGDFAGSIGVGAPLDSAKLSKILSTLTFEDEKARRLIKWKSRSLLETGII